MGCRDGWEKDWAVEGRLQGCCGLTEMKTFSFGIKK